MVTAFEDTRCTRPKPSPKHFKRNILVPHSGELVNKPTYWIDTSMDAFFRTAQSILAEKHSDRHVPSISKLRHVFNRYCSKYIKTSRGADYHNCPFCIIMKVN